MSKSDRSGEKNFICPMCNKSIDLQNDDTADENGLVMHAQCYMKRVGATERTPPASHHTE